MVQLFGIVAAVLSLVCVLLGLPAQIMKNFQKKSCEGLSFLLPFTAFLSYSSWTLYGAAKPDFFLLFSQIPGAILMLIILVQFAIYKRGER